MHSQQLAFFILTPGTMDMGAPRTDYTVWTSVSGGSRPGQFLGRGSTLSIALVDAQDGLEKLSSASRRSGAADKLLKIQCLACGHIDTLYKSMSEIDEIRANRNSCTNCGRWEIQSSASPAKEAEPAT